MRGFGILPEMEKYVVLGASPNPQRYSHKIVRSLLHTGNNVIPIGYAEGSISGLQILTGTPTVETGRTLLLYIGTGKQPAYYNYILDELQPCKIIFNPGTENKRLRELAEIRGIACIEGCALVMAGESQI